MTRAALEMETDTDAAAETIRRRLDDAALGRLARVGAEWRPGASVAPESAPEARAGNGAELGSCPTGLRATGGSWAGGQSAGIQPRPTRLRGRLGLCLVVSIGLWAAQAFPTVASPEVAGPSARMQQSGRFVPSAVLAAGSLSAIRGAVPRDKEFLVRQSQSGWFGRGSAVASVRRAFGRAVGLAALGAASAAYGADRLVPQQYPTIQAAVNASSNGDRVIVSPGLYRESVRFLGKSVMLEGVSAAETANTILTGTGVPGPAVFVSDSTGYVGTVGLRNLTVTSEGVQEPSQAAGVIVSYLGTGATFLLEHCIFRDIRSSSTDAGAVFLGHPSSLVRDCLFMRNSSTVHGQAIYAYDNVQAVVENSVFIDHTFGTGTFYSRIGANILVRNCVVRNSNVLNAHFQTGTVTFQNNTGCSIGALSNGGYVDGGGNNWNGPCPDCDGNGVIDLQEVLFEGADCNGNGTVDACDLAANPLLDRNGDGILDACQCIPDITGNGVVDGIDLAAVLGAWGSAGKGEFVADVTGDGQVDGADLAVVLSGWGPCP